MKPFPLAPPVISALLALWASFASADLALVEGGAPRAVIVLSDSPSAQAREAAELLRNTVERMTGARLEILGESQAPPGPRVLVGDSRAARSLGPVIPAQLTPAMNEEEYALRTVGNALVIAGNEHPFYRGVVYGVDDLLNRWGCRWFFPGEFGEVIPRSATLRVPDLDVRERPDFRFRNIWYSGWMPVTPEDAEAYRVWMDRNRMNSLAGISLPGDGTVTRLAPPERFFETRPHIYALDKEGKRSPEMLCLTEPDAVATAAETIKEHFRAHPDAFTFGFAPPDGHPQCFCERCQKSSPNFRGKGYGEPSLSDVWFRFANAVAREVVGEFPDRMLLTNGYANRVRPPEGAGPLSPNLGIQSAMLDTCVFHPVDDPRCWQRRAYRAVLDRWTRDLGCVFIYDYDPGKAIDGMPFPMLHNLGKDFRYFKDRGVWGFWTEGQNCWMVTHLNYYVRARLMWDAAEDVRGIVRDYCREFYGPAARPVERYLWTLEDAVGGSDIHTTFGRPVPWRVILTPEVTARMGRLLSQAETRASADPEKGRVAVLRGVHEYMRAHLAMEGAAAAGHFAEAVGRADEMLARREALCRVNPSLIPVTPEWCRDHSGAAEWYRASYADLAARVDGTRGTLVAMTPREWAFRKDPRDMGVLEQWHLERPGTGWDTVDTTLYWEAQGIQDRQGYGYEGKARCMTDTDLPASCAGKTVFLTFGAVYGDELWVWVNGELAGHRLKQSTRAPVDLDVTRLVRPGASNRVALLTATLPADRNARAGIHRRAFFWTPTP